MKTRRDWLAYALITTVFWGIWGALSAIPEKAGFPGAMIYLVWSVSMIIPAIFALRVVKWKIEYNLKAIFYGTLIGITGAGGQLALFTRALKEGPAHLIFPIISLSPVVTIILSFLFLKERIDKKGVVAIILALIAIPLLSLTSNSGEVKGYDWLIFSFIVFMAWGIQAFFMKLANEKMHAESIFLYMTITGLLMVPFALYFVDFSQPINYGWSGMYAAFLIQLLNSIGALCIVYAFRYGKAVIVSPLTNAAAPVITIGLSLILFRVFPQMLTSIGMGLAIISIFLFARED